MSEATQEYQPKNIFLTGGAGEQYYDLRDVWLIESLYVWLAVRGTDIDIFAISFTR